jgi:hypothetical protein
MEAGNGGFRLTCRIPRSRYGLRQGQLRFSQVDAQQKDDDHAGKTHVVSSTFWVTGLACEICLIVYPGHEQPPDKQSHIPLGKASAAKGRIVVNTLVTKW